MTGKRGEKVTTDYLAEVFETAYNGIIDEWRKQGMSDAEIIKKLDDDTINNSMKALLEQASKDYHDFFVEKKVWVIS